MSMKSVPAAGACAVWMSTVTFAYLLAGR